jgi:hypothetical protein
MGQTRTGVVKILAKKAGLTVLAYESLRSKGEKWCMRCRRWHPEREFGKDRTRYDGLNSSCSESRSKRQSELHQRVPPELRKPHGPARLPSRDGDKKQARHFVNLSVQSGALPRPSTLPCFDCGHAGPDRRHEYDHYLGYSAEHHENVQSVCARCHARRERRIRRG